MFGNFLILVKDVYQADVQKCDCGKTQYLGKLSKD